MSSGQPAFDRVGEQFLDYYDSVRGYVREQLTRKDLEPYLGSAAMRIVDVGGGDARDAIWLARQGHNVKVIDPSTRMLQEGQKNLEKAGSLTGSVELIEGTSTTIKNQEGGFDVVLSHGVLMYDLENPQQHVKNLVALARPDGVVSILTKGYGGSAARLVVKHDVQELNNLRQSHQVINNLGERVWAFEPLQLNSLIEKAGAVVMKWSGIRIASELLNQPISDFSKSELEAILNMEEQLGQDPSTRGMGQMLHFIAIRK
jgi:SAM-dependent methyltransferase